MNFITGKQMPRRTFLRGVGATVALPFLDSMVSPGSGRAPAAAAERTRLICIEEVHGLAGCNNWGASKQLFAPATSESPRKVKTAEGSGRTNAKKLCWSVASVSTMGVFPSTSFTTCSRVGEHRDADDVVALAGDPHPIQAHRR